MELTPFHDKTIIVDSNLNVPSHHYKKIACAIFRYSIINIALVYWPHEPIALKVKMYVQLYIDLENNVGVCIVCFTIRLLKV